MVGEAQRSRSRNRKPLSDLTNTVSQSQSSQSSSATVTASKTKKKLIRERERKPKPSAVGYAGDPPASLLRFRSSSLTGDENCGVSEIRNDLNKRQTVRKASAERLGNVGGKRNGDMGILELCTVPRKKMQRCSKPKQDASLQDFIRQQRAYFNEIDAFELSEEEVASGNELD